jgi:hypothetical protein
MDAHFSIDVDPARKLLKVALSGFYTVADVERYHAAIHVATARAGGLPSAQRMVCDISGMHIQTQDVVVAFQKVMSDPKYQHRRVALVVASTLARMQAQRATSAREVHFFPTTAEAEAWLFSQPDAASAAA